jgi:hypothetical protein
MLQSICESCDRFDCHPDPGSSDEVQLLVDKSWSFSGFGASGLMGSKIETGEEMVWCLPYFLSLRWTDTIASF